ncbi:MAG: DUF1576 domain-containing protein [Ruminococcaceae bacterium]|nr:DUF1576 domain-containing protein [Oscillospiraceae bacterium]
MLLPYYSSEHISAFDAEEHHANNAPKLIGFFTLFITVCFFIATPLGVIYSREQDFWGNVYRILTSPSKLVTDYFALGGLGSAFFNTAVCGLATNFIIIFSGIKAKATTFAGYMLVVAHGFYGLNFLNMWPTIFGVLLYCAVCKQKFSDNVHIALFSTALGPFISDFIFRYTITDTFDASHPQVTVLGIIFALCFGIAAGFVVPALLPGTTAMHRGFNMYKAGLAIGILGIFVYSFMYESLGIPAPDVIKIDNPEYYALEYGYRGFMNIFFIILFTCAIIFGFIFNRYSFRGYKELFKSVSYGVDFLDKFGMSVCLINFGIYGFCILGYLNLIFILPQIFGFLPSGIGFTGPTVGVVFAALTFSADGQQPRTVAPIALGYVLLSVAVCIICSILKAPIPWTLSTQGYINGLAFSTGLCAFSGKYGKRYGVLAGFLSAIICTSTSEMHGGFVLYNGGFTAGLTALVLLPILDFYKVKPKFEDDIK